MTENPFIEGWLWYYDLLWRYWYIVLVMAVIAVWLRYRRYAKRPKKVQRIDRLEYDGENFHVVIENGKLTFTDKETGKVYERH
jgi:hypothetical protein